MYGINHILCTFYVVDLAVEKFQNFGLTKFEIWLSHARVPNAICASSASGKKQLLLDLLGLALGGGVEQKNIYIYIYTVCTCKCFLKWICSC